jgi:hypothetical protein
LDDNPVKAFASMQKLTAAAAQSVPILRKQLRPASADTPRIERLLGELDSNDFRKRTKAVKELAEVGEPALPALLQALVSPVSLEARRRMESLVEKLTPENLVKEEIRLIRGVEVLERVGNSEARQVLLELAQGARGALSTRQATSALDRLRRTTAQ